MPNLSAQLLDAEGNPPVVGDDFDCERNITEVPDNDTLIKAWLFIKSWSVYKGTNLDADAIITKEVTTVAVGGEGQITDDGSGDNAATVLFQLTATETTTLTGGAMYFYGMKVKTTGGKYKTVEQGSFIPVKPLVKAT